MEEFVACFSDVADPRQDNARHDLHETERVNDFDTGGFGI